MNRWDIFKASTDATPKPHPVVVLSPGSVCQNLSIKLVNVALCSTVPAGESLGPWEVGLDEADGLAHLTRCQCHMVYAVSKSRLIEKLGRVSEYRRVEIRRKIREALDL